MLEESKTDDSVVGGFVEGDLGCSCRGWLGIDVIYALGVEDFVDTMK